MSEPEPQEIVIPRIDAELDLEADGDIVKVTVVFAGLRIKGNVSKETARKIGNAFLEASGDEP